MRNRKMWQSMFWCLIAVTMLGGVGRAAEPVYDYNNVVIVLDASGSMNSKLSGTSTRKIDAAKQALREVLKQVSADTQIGLLVFSSANLQNDWVYPLGPRDDAKLMQAIGLPEPKAGTPLGAYIKKGADRLLEQRARQHGYGTYRLLIVTDGEAGDVPLMERYVPEVMARGITIDVIGVDMKSNHTLATKVHSYRKANDPQSLTRAIAEVFAEVGGTQTDGATEEAFAELAPIPTEMASAMITALATSGNNPIGSIKRMPPQTTSRVAPPAPAQPRHQPTASKASRGGGPKPIGQVLFIALIVVVVLAGLLFRTMRQGM